MFLFRKRHNSDRKEKSAGFQDLAVERKAGNIDAKSRIKLDTISKAEYNSIMKNICELKTDISGEIVKMNKKVTKMEEIMSDFLKKLNDAFPDASIATNSTLPLDGIERRAAIDDENKVQSHLSLCLHDDILCCSIKSRNPLKILFPTLNFHVFCHFQDHRPYIQFDHITYDHKSKVGRCIFMIFINPICSVQL